MFKPFPSKPDRRAPHPGCALGGDGGKWIFESIFAALEKKLAAKTA